MPDWYFKDTKTNLGDLWALYFSGTDLDSGDTPPKEVIIQAQNEIVRLRAVGDMLAAAIRGGEDIMTALERWDAARSK